MFAIFKEDRVPQPFYRSTRIGRARRPRTKADMSRARSCGPDRTQWHASPHRLSDFLSDVRAALREWRRRKNSRLELARLDERMLRDIGLTRAAADHEINKPFGGNNGDEPGVGGKDDACRRGALESSITPPVAGALDRLVPSHPLDREVELPPGVVQISSDLSERMFLGTSGRPPSFENAPRKQFE
jgi:uncharacterized protein YjiS (DUF1127 family)